MNDSLHFSSWRSFKRVSGKFSSTITGTRASLSWTGGPRHNGTQRTSESARRLFCRGAGLSDWLLDPELCKRSEGAGIGGPTINRNLPICVGCSSSLNARGRFPHVPYFPMQRESEPRQRFLERPDFERLRAVKPEHLHVSLTFCYENRCRTGAMRKIIWPWVALAMPSEAFAGRED